MKWQEYLDQVIERQKQRQGKKPQRGREMHLVPREDVALENRPPLLPGKKSRRPRKNVWVPK